MKHDEDREAIARAMIDDNLYMTLATADPSGRPWASPVYYAVAGYREFFWVSEPEATHSRNLASRPELAIVIFDSTVPINTGRGVYMSPEPRSWKARSSTEASRSSLAAPRSTVESRLPADVQLANPARSKAVEAVVLRPA